MSIATEQKVEALLKTCDSLTQAGKAFHERIALLETRVGDLESELEALKDRANGRQQKR